MTEFIYGQGHATEGPLYRECLHSDGKQIPRRPEGLLVMIILRNSNAGLANSAGRLGDLNCSADAPFFAEDLIEGAFQLPGALIVVGGNGVVLTLQDMQLVGDV
jgi:hypothetical protein